MAERYIVEIYEDSGNNPGIRFSFEYMVDAAGFVDICLKAYPDKAGDALRATISKEEGGHEQ